ncbi:adenylate/guanylate cyclase domain-containing protein [Dictyobacter halimunensis]|uniref:adenylate/guanylate cyclase domain-containing protein n=1 Tax=Dictyobacter halimunensis TaxID=3026934 RepID=UPI0030C723A9
MRCPNCQTLNPPNAKFCLECGHRLAGCPNCGTINPTGAKFCIECGTALQPRREPTAPLAHTPVVDADKTQAMRQLAIPQIDASLLASAEERRVVTVMFADITGSTPLADRLDPEDMRAILTGYFNLMTEQIRKHDGTVEKYIGDAVMAIFGTPVTHEDDPDRAIRAALDMQAALNSFNEHRLARDPEATRLQMRIGINTGEVAAPSATATQYHDFLITGDAVNIAARLQQVATPDTILVGERTYLSSRAVFDFKAIAPLHLKGKSEQISAYVVQGLRQSNLAVDQHPRGLTGSNSRLVGRDLELTLLHASYARVQTERRPHLITILGAPGIGKSRLVREFITREQELVKSTSSTGELTPPLVLKGRCPPYGEGLTYWPLIEILRTILHVQKEDTDAIIRQRFVEFLRLTFTKARINESPESIAETLLRSVGRGLLGKQLSVTDETGYDEHPRSEQRPPARNTTDKQSGAQGALLRAWRVLLEALGELQPVIVVIDDIQWADEALLDLFEYLTERITSAPLLFICPARPDFLEHRRDWGGGHRNFTAIELDSLTWEESSDLVDALLNTSEMPETLRYTILARSEGNPFFVEEIVRMFIDQGILVRKEDQERRQSYWQVAYPRHGMMGEVGQPVQAVNNEPLEEGLLTSPYLIPLPHVPDTIQGVLAARVDLLNPTEKLVLQHGSIIGRNFWLSSLLELSQGLSPEAVMEALVALMRRDFIAEISNKAASPMTPDRAFIFKHILIRDVVYNNIPRQRRAHEHARIALWLDEQASNQQVNFAELIAYHYQRALAAWSPNAAIDYIEIYNQHHPTAPPIRLTRENLRDRAVKYLTLTGDQAMDSYYSLRALQAYNDAFELLSESHADKLTQSIMLAKIGQAHAQHGNLDESWRQSRRALQMIPQDDMQTNKSHLLKLYERMSLLATRWLSRFDTQPDPQEIRQYIDAGLKILEGTPTSREHIAFRTYLAFWYIRQLGAAPHDQKAWLAEQALLSGNEALQMAEELNSPRTLSLTLDAMGFIYFEYHQYKRALELQERRLQLEDLIRDREELYDLYFSLGSAYEQVGEYAVALTYYGRAWSNALSMESPSMVLTGMVGRMRTWYRWNRWRDAQQVAEDILQFVEKYQQDEKRQLWALETLATIAYHQGRQEDGDRYAQQYKRLIIQQSDREAYTEGAPPSTRLHAIHLAQEDWEQALSDYRIKFELSEPFPNPAILATLMDLLVNTDNSEGEEALFDRAIQLCEEAGSRKSLAVALRARGKMLMQKLQWEQAEEDLRRSLKYCEELDLPWERAHTLYNLGLLYRARADISINNGKHNSDMELMRYYLEQALGFYESLEARPSSRRVRRLLKEEQSPELTTSSGRIRAITESSPRSDLP